MIPGSASPFFLGSSLAVGGGGAGYQVERSLRFNSSDSGFLSRTPAVAGNRQLMTQSLWIKRSRITTGAEQNIFVCFNSGGDYSAINFKTDYVDQIQIINVVGGIVAHKITEPRLRDPSAWYHILWSIDEANGTAEDRFKLYINNQRVVNWALNSNSGGGNNWSFNRASVAHQFGSTGNADFYLADIHFIDGQALTPSSFTEVSATTGQLIPLAYSGSFGTNGFWLKFSDNSALTSGSNVGVGKDYSGNANYFNTSGLSVTAGAGNDSLVDTPTSYGTDTGVGGEVRGNYATWNPLDTALIGGTNTSEILSNGNLDMAGSGNDNIFNLATIGVTSGLKAYWEVTATVASNDWCISGILSNNKTFGDTIAALASGEIMIFAVDGDTGNYWFGRNGAWLTGNPATGTSPRGTRASTTIFPAARTFGTTVRQSANFGQRAFAYTAPSGFKALCDTNLGAPLVAKPNTVFDVVAYAGSSSPLAITLPGGFSPNLVWLKCRSFAYYHWLTDTVRGTNKQLSSNDSIAEESRTDRISSFDASGFTVANHDVNSSGNTFVAWCWDAGEGSAVSNTQGSITSQVRANVSAGFSVVTYTGNAVSGATVGHGLGVAPQLIIIKSRVDAYDWIVYHASIGNTGAVRLNTTAATQTTSTWFNNSGPSSTTFTLGNTGGTNESGSAFVAYCFAPVSGYSSFGSYTGNGSTDGPFVYTGFRPRWVMVKNTTLGTVNDYWVLFDAARNGYNVTEQILIPNSSDAEGTSTNNGIDLLSNGFKWRATHTSRNASGSTYIYAAFAESPFQFSRAR